MEELLPKISNCFDFLCVHRELLEDKYRLNAYKSAIKKIVRKGDIVVDIGTGTGILTFMAVEAGAKRVYAMEKSNIIKLAEKIARRNQISSHITFIKGDSRRIMTPKIKADVLISEVLGHYALDENILPIVIDARKRFLKQGGQIIPNRIRLYICPIEYKEFHHGRSFWKKKIFGFDYAPALEFELNNIFAEVPNNIRYLASPQMLHCINLLNVTTEEFKSDVQFRILKRGFFHGFVGWFELLLAPGIELVTGPGLKKTHWERVFFPVSKPCKVEPSNKITFNFSFETIKDKILVNWRGIVLRKRKKIMTFSQTTKKVYL